MITLARLEQLGLMEALGRRFTAIEAGLFELVGPPEPGWLPAADDDRPPAARWADVLAAMGAQSPRCAALVRGACARAPQEVAFLAAAEALGLAPPSCGDGAAEQVQVDLLLDGNVWRLGASYAATLSVGALAAQALGRPEDAGLVVETPRPEGDWRMLPPAQTLGAAVAQGARVLRLRASAPPAARPGGLRSASGAALHLEEGELLDGRFEVRRYWARGGFARVYQAWDQRLHSLVALKVLAPGTAARAARREVQALERLRVPGVVALREALVVQDHVVLVMDWGVGRPFPGCPTPMRWEDLAPRVRALLGALAQVHAQAFVHGDLKPENVLIDDQGRVTLLDLGLSRELAPLAEGEGVAATPLYAAPEVLLEDRRATPDTDLYAVGVMIWMALTGDAPWGVSTQEALMQRHREGRLPVWPAGAPRPPADIERWLLGLLAPNAADRPANAAQALDAIQEPLRPILPRWFERHLDQREAGPLRAEDLEPLFLAPERLLHLRSRAARALRQATGGRRELLAPVLRRWEQQGLVRRVEGGLSVHRPALERVEGAPAPAPVPDRAVAVPPDLPPDPRLVLFYTGVLGADATVARVVRLTRLGEARVAQALATLCALGLVARGEDDALEDRTGGQGRMLGGAQRRRGAHAGAAAQLEPGAPMRLLHLLRADDLRGAVAEARHLARLSLAAGAAQRAARCSMDAVEWAVDLEDPALIAEVAEELVTCALGGEDPVAQLDTLALLRRLGVSSAGVLLLEASCAAVSGDADRAMETLEAQGPMATPSLEDWRLSTMAFVASRLDLERFERAADQAVVAARTRGGRARALQALGWVRYRQARPEEAAALFRETLQLRELPGEILTTQSSLGSALLDAGDLGAARQVLVAAEAIAAETQHIFVEARSVWLLRRIQCAQGAALPVDAGLLLAAEQSQMATWFGLILVTEATVAHSQGATSLALALARRGAQVLQASGFAPVSLLGWALAHTCGAQLSSGEIHAVTALARREGVIGITLQVLALLGAPCTPEDLAAAEEWVAKSPSPERIAEVLSPLSVLSRLAR